MTHNEDALSLMEEQASCGDVVARGDEMEVSAQSDAQYRKLFIAFNISDTVNVGLRVRCGSEVKIVSLF